MDEKCLNNNYWGSFRILFSVAAGWLILIITHTKDGRRQQQPSTIETNPPSLWSIGFRKQEEELFIGSRPGGSTVKFYVFSPRARDL